jgi:hypothetical protein
MKKLTTGILAILVVLLMVLSVLPVTGSQENGDDGPVELIEKRDVFSKTYYNGNGEYTAEIYYSPIHYYNEGTAQYDEIDPTIETIDPSTFGNSKNVLKTEFAAIAGSKDGVKLVNAGNELSIQFKTTELGVSGPNGYELLEEAQPEFADVAGNELNYPNVFTDTTEQYIVKNGELKQNFILANAAVYPAGAEYLQFVMKYNINGLEVYVNDVKMESDFTTDMEIVFKNSEGDIAFALLAGIAYDSDNLAVPLLYDVSFEQDGLVVALNVPIEWLNSAMYPVTVDPTITLYYSYGCYTYYYYGYRKYSSSSGYIWNSRRTYRSAMEFRTSSIPNSANINNIYVRTYYYSYGVYGTWYMKHMANRPRYSSAYTVYRDAYDGATYLSGSSYSGYKSGNLPSTARADMKSKLTQDWFAIGLSGSVYGSSSWYYAYFRMYSRYTYLRVTYTTGLNRPPVANADGPYSGNEGSSIRFDGSRSSDPDGDRLTYRWFIDGRWTGWSSSPYTYYTWGDDYSGQVILEVNDGSLTDQDSTTVRVYNVAPTAYAGPDQEEFSGIMVNFQGSFKDPGWLDTHKIGWTFGDGNSASGSLQTSHVYAKPGLYTVTLTVTDDDNGQGQDTLQVLVKMRADIRFEPRTLNLDSNGKWINVKVEAFPYDPGYSVMNVDKNTVSVEGIGLDLKHGVWNVNKFRGKAPREAVCDWVPGPMDPVEMTVRGQLTTGEVFEGQGDFCAIQ